MSTNHPFLDTSFAPKWSQLTAEHVVPDMEAALEAGKTALAAIEKLPDGEETFENTFLALEIAEEIVSIPWGRITHLDGVNDHPELRTAHKAVLPKVSEHFSAIPLNQDIYRKLKNFRDTPACNDLDPVEKRFVTETLNDFEDAGANLKESVRTRLQEIQAALSEKTKLYSEHQLDSQNAFEHIVDDVAQLKGLPDSMIEAARLDALGKEYGTEESPKYRFTLHAPSIFPVLQFAESDSLRKTLFEGMMKVGHYGKYENETLVAEIIALRKEKATLLGKDGFPDWVLSRRMAKNGKSALAFVEDLNAKTREAFDRENQELIDYKAQKTGKEAGPLHPWEGGYWSECLRKEKYAFDEEALRPYFPIASVMKGMFSLVEQVFAINVVELTDPKPETWHPDVQVYKISDSRNGRDLGSFYADWHPRESKRSGAWMDNLLVGEWRPEGRLPHLGFMAGNLMAPVGDAPALLNHREVETIFHEFGHLIHHVLSDVKIRSLSGTNVAWDFVELPSQIMENWCWERVSLDLFARHYETGEPIPEDLFQKMKKARTFGAGRGQMRQLALGKMDLELHLNFNSKDGKDLDAFIDEALVGYLPPCSAKIPNIVRLFGHLFSDPVGYASGYYSYKWAEVLDADAFTRFSKEGILNQETGLAFREEILAKGNSEEPDVLFRNFMGREPDPEALLVRLGLA